MPAATATVRCNDEDHRVTWRRGKLALDDHDLASEATAMALGGERPPCLQVLQLWRNLHGWAMSADIFRAMSARLGPDSLLAPGPLRSVHELGLILTWERRWQLMAFFSDHERLLEEQVRGRALDPLRQHVEHWRRRSGSRRISSLQVAVQRPGRPATLVGTMDSVSATATARLGAAWVVGVWARGLAVVDGAFVLALEADQGDASPAAPRVRAVRWEGGADRGFAPVTRAARVSRGAAGGWRLAWEDGEP